MPESPKPEYSKVTVEEITETGGKFMVPGFIPTTFDGTVFGLNMSKEQAFLLWQKLNEIFGPGT